MSESEGYLPRLSMDGVEEIDNGSSSDHLSLRLRYSYGTINMVLAASVLFFFKYMMYKCPSYMMVM